MKRKIISIDESRCTGCGQCIPDCPEGAIQLIEGKARLVSDLFCDGLGACIGTCPEGAITVIEREALPYDEKTVMENIVRQGAPVIRAHLEHLLGHGQNDLYNEAIAYLQDQSIAIPGHDRPVRHPESAPPSHAPFASCPGSAAWSIARSAPAIRRQTSDRAGSELRQWPIQLRLVHPDAPYFEHADLLISADCVPFACAGFHADLLRDRILIIFCPKLDTDIDGYIEKLTRIFSHHTIKSITIVPMEVPCCSGVRYVVDQALEQSGKQIPVTEKTITIQGEIV